MVGYYVSPLSDRPSAHVSISSWFALSNLNSFIQILRTHISGVCGLRLLMGKFCQFLTELSALHTSLLLFADGNLSKYLLIFTKLGMCIDIMKI